MEKEKKNRTENKNLVYMMQLIMNIQMRKVNSGQSPDANCGSFKFRSQLRSKVYFIIIWIINADELSFECMTRFYTR